MGQQDKLHSVPADPTKWSEKSQQTVGFHCIKEYRDITYDCWRCKKSAVLSAADQRYTYEVKKAPIDQRRILCTGRRAAVVRVDFDSASPVSILSRKYVLVIASERQTVPMGVKRARAWIDAGASYICAWEPNSAEVEEAFVYATFLPEYGEPLPFTLMTTSHGQRPQMRPFGSRFTLRGLLKT